MPNLYKIGQVVRCKGRFRDTDGEYRDPTSVFFQLINPSDVQTSLEYGVDGTLVKESTGVYYVDVDVGAIGAGMYNYRFYSTGTYQTANEDRFEVMASPYT